MSNRRKARNKKNYEDKFYADKKAREEKEKV